MGATASVLVGLSIAMWSQICTGQAAGDLWSLTGLKGEAVPGIWVLDGADFVRQGPQEGDGLIEIQGRLKVESGSRLDPVALAEIRVRSTASSPNSQPRSAFAVGSSVTMCRYLSPGPRGRDVSTMKVGKEGSLALSRDSGRTDAPLKLAVGGSSIDLCLAFSGKDKPGDSLLLEFGGRSFVISVVDKPARVADAKQNAASTPLSKSPTSSRAAWIVALGLLGLSLTAAAVWRWRVRLTSVLGQEAKSVAAGDVRAGSVAFGEVPALARVSAEHCRTSFARVGTNAGPGKSDFEAALRVLQGERFREADSLLSEAITKGLPPTYECGAWSFRGQVAVALGEIPAAVNHFLNALGGSEVTLQAALPAAMHLAVIYRALDMRADAARMEAVAKAANGIGIVLEPEAIKQIQEQALAYRKALRAVRPSRLRILAERVFNRSTSTSAT